MATPIRTRKVSHVLLHASDIERSVKFYTEILGFKETDRNHLGMVFLRNGTDHHTFGLVPGPPAATVAPKARELLAQQGIEFVFEGRRGAGCNVSLDFWISYQFACQMLDEFRHGSVFFIGDAAHLVPPFGARGGNSGIADAFNLSWKLAGVLQGRYSKDLLRTYGNEELAHATGSHPPSFRRVLRRRGGVGRRAMAMLLPESGRETSG